MKLCSICDKKIEGTWCRNCHRFVKTYEIPGTIYLNERHNPENDRDCTYHTDATRTVSTRSTSGGIQRPVTSGGAIRSSEPGASSGANLSQTKKKRKKVALIIFIVYFIGSCLGVLGPMLVNVFNEASRGFLETFRDNEMDEEETELTPEEMEVLFDRGLRGIALSGLEPVYQVKEEGYRIDYYNPEDITEIGYSCDSGHFDMTFDAFEDWLAVSWTDTYEYVDDISDYGNYCYTTDDYTWVQFSCYRDYYASDDFAIRIEYDTATEQVHAIGFVAREGGMDEGLCYALLLYFEPETEWTREQFAKDVEYAKEAGDYATLYYSEEVYVSFEMNEEAYSLVFYPVY